MSEILERPEHALKVLALVMVAGFIALELLLSRIRRFKTYDLKDTIANFAMYGGYIAINSLWLPIAYNIYVIVHEHSLFRFGEQWWLFDGRTPIWQWLLLFLLDDFCYYAFHRTSHKLRFFWASHVTHHSSQQFNFSVGFRQTWLPFVAIIFWIPLAWIGFDPLMIMTMQFLSLVFQALLHTQHIRSYGPLDLVFNSPSHHRVHHGTQEKYIDKNFGGVLIIWDRIFGTFVKEQEKPIYGIGLEKPLYNPLAIAFLEYGRLVKDLWRRDNA